MRTKTGALAAITGLALVLSASASRAAIVETIINSDEDVTVGSITFPTLTGDSAAGVLFSYIGFMQADITSISWTLDPTTDAVSRSISMHCGVTTPVRTAAIAPTRL